MLCAANADSQQAQYALGRCHESGYGVFRSRQRAILWYGRAVRERKGLQRPEEDYLLDIDARREALVGIGRLTTTGNASGERLRRGIACLRAALEYNSGDSMAECAYLLGELYRTGRGVPQSREMAIIWYRTAAGGRLNPADKRLRELGAPTRPEN